MAITTKQIYKVYKNLHLIVGKDVNDNFISVNEYNDLLATLYLPFIYSKTNVFLKGESIPIEVISSSALLAKLSYSESVSPSTGVIDLGSSGDLTYDYLYWVSCRTTSAYGTQRRRVELVSHQEMDDRMMNMALPRPDEYPFTVLDYNVTNSRHEATIYPTNIPSVELTYIRKPSTPFLDYYIDTSRYRQYLDVGEDLSLITTGTYKDGANMNVVTDTSDTVDIDLPDSYIEEFMFTILEKLEKRKPDYNGVQYSVAKQGEKQ